MLIVTARNLGTRDDNTADYRVQVKTTLELLADFTVENFDRSRGWQKLLGEVVSRVVRSKTQPARGRGKAHG